MSNTPNTLLSEMPPRYCRRCGYNLAALPEPRCPECGRVFDPADSRTFQRHPLRRWLHHIRRAAAGLLILLLLLAAVWGWFFWGWYSERQALISLTLDPDNPDHVVYIPIRLPFGNRQLGPAGFVLKRAVWVNLDHRAGVTDITPVARLTNLQTLYLDGTDVTDLTPLARLTSMQVLWLRRTRVEDLSPLAELTNLRELDIVGTRVSDLRPLARLTKMEELKFDDTTVADLTPLAGLTNLDELLLTHTDVHDLAPLSGLKSLHFLQVPEETITEAQVEALRRDLPDCGIDRL